MRRGACTGQGRTQRGHDFTQTNRGPMGLYLTPLCFNTNSPERKSSPFGRGGGGKSGLCCLGAQSSTQGVGWVQAASRQGKMAPRLTQCMAQWPGRKVCSSVGASSSLWWGAVQTPPPPPAQDECRGRKLSPRSLVLSLTSFASLASIVLTASTTGQIRHHDQQAGEERTFSGGGTEGPVVHVDGKEGL